MITVVKKMELEINLFDIYDYD